MGGYARTKAETNWGEREKKVGLEKDSVRQAHDSPRLRPGSSIPGSQKEDGFWAEPMGNSEFQGQNLCQKLVSWAYVYWNMAKEWLYSVSKRELPPQQQKKPKIQHIPAFMEFIF